MTIDGADVVAVYNTCKEAVERARRGEGPTIIESVTMRMQGHAAHDTAWYVPKGLLSEWKEKDPVESLEKLLSSQGILSARNKDAMAAEVRRLVEDALRSGLEAPYPPGEEAAGGVYARG